MTLVQVGPILIIPDGMGPTLETEIETLEIELDTGWCLKAILPKALPECFKMQLSSGSTEAKTILGHPVVHLHKLDLYVMGWCP